MSRRVTTGALGVERERWVEALRIWSWPGGSSARRDYERFQRRHQWHCAVAWLTEDLGISRARLLEATKGQPFRRDFGQGRRMIVAYNVEGLLRWALGQARGSSSPRRARPRPAIAQAA